MAFDQQRYRREVLDPARRSGPPADLFVRYGFQAGLPSDTVFRHAGGRGRQPVEVVPVQARVEQADRRAAGPACRAGTRPGTQPGRIPGPPPAAAGRGVTAAGRAHKRGERLARRTLPPSAGCAMPPGRTRTRFRRALAAAAITVVDRLPELPLSPPRGYPQLGPELQILGLKLSAEVIFGTETVRKGFRVIGGFRLADGRQLSRQALEEATANASAMPHTDARKTPTEAVLAVLRSAEREGRLDEPPALGDHRPAPPGRGGGIRPEGHREPGPGHRPTAGGSWRALGRPAGPGQRHQPPPADRG